MVRAGVVPAITASLPGVAVMLGIFLTVAPGAGRMAAGMVLGLGLCTAVGLRQVGRERLAAALRLGMGGG